MTGVGDWHDEQQFGVRGGKYQGGRKNLLKQPTPNKIKTRNESRVIRYTCEDGDLDRLKVIITNNPNGKPSTHQLHPTRSPVHNQML